MSKKFIFPVWKLSLHNIIFFIAAACWGNCVYGQIIKWNKLISTFLSIENPACGVWMSVCVCMWCVNVVCEWATGWGFPQLFWINKTSLEQITEPFYHYFMYSLVSLLSGIYLLPAMHSLLVTIKQINNECAAPTH